MSWLAIDFPFRYRRWPFGLRPLSLRALRWLAVIVPIALIIGVDFARHFVFPFSLHDIVGFTVLWAGSIIGAIAFSWLVFGTIERMQREIVGQNRELANLYQNANRQAGQLVALREAGMALTSELSLDTVLQKVVDLSRELVGARFGSLAVLNDEMQIERLITSGLSPEARARISKLPEGLGIMATVPGDAKPVRIANVSKHPLSVGFPPNHPKMTTMLGVPIVSKARLIGNLKLTNKAGGDQFTQQDEDAVVMLAAQAAIAIENARFHKQEQTLAVLEERERIALDLHDGIIQGIYAIGLNVEQCIEKARDPAPELALHLSKAVDELNGVMKDVRNYIFALQPTELEDHDLSCGVQTLAHEFQVNSLIDAEVTIRDYVDGRLSREQLAHVFQIVREALTNVLRHARATAVAIEIIQRESRIELVIRDNGSGFNAVRVYPSGRGLRNMAERARSIGGSFRIDSTADSGTAVTLTVPVMESS